MSSSNSLERYNAVCSKCSKLTTHQYSTSFTLGIRSLSKEYHDPIYAIYGFVRFADEIVDTFDRTDKSELLSKFKADTYQAIEQKIHSKALAISLRKHLVWSYQNWLPMHAFLQLKQSSRELKVLVAVLCR